MSTYHEYFQESYTAFLIFPDRKSRIVLIWVTPPLGSLCNILPSLLEKYFLLNTYSLAKSELWTRKLSDIISFSAWCYKMGRLDLSLQPFHCLLMVRDCLEWDSDEILTICVLVFLLRLDVAGLKAGGLLWGPQI